MNNSEAIERIKSVKSRIEKLIEDGHLTEAKATLEKFESKMPGDADICSMRAVIAIMEGDLDEAKYIIQDGLKKDSVHFDLLFNLAYIHEQQGNYQEAADLYCKTATVAHTDIQKQNINMAIERIQSIDASANLAKKSSIVFFVKEGMDSFLGDIIDGLSVDYWTRKIIVDDLKQIDEGMKWADVCWFEWCDELIIYGSKLQLAHEKLLVCRLHSYEAFTNYIFNVNWINVDKTIFISEHLQKIVLDQKIPLLKEKTVVIPNGIDINKYSFKIRNAGFNIAYVGYINYKKGPMLLLHTFKTLFDKDSRYKLFIAGKFQDLRDELYFDQMIKEFGMEGNVIFDGWQDNVDQWLENKNFILCTSLLESQNMSVMQAMCKGIKPVVHNFVGAKAIYAEEYIWNTMDQAVKAITKEPYNSNRYRSFVADNYSLEQQLNKISSLLANLLSYKNINEKVINILSGIEKPEELMLDELTVLIPCYNRAKMIKEDLDNGLKLGHQPKLIVDDCSTSETEWLDQIAKDFQESMSKLIRKEQNGGVSDSRYVGLNAIETKYTTFVDDDNIMLCIDRNMAIRDISRLNNEACVVIPRYIVNNYRDRLSLGYDRSHYNGMNGAQVLHELASYGEMMGLLTGGAIGDTNWMSEHSYCPMFKVSEDFVMLARMMASKLDEKVLITEGLVFVRRFLDEGSTLNPNLVKLMLSLFSQAIACYYCLKFGIANTEEVIIWMKNRSSLIQKLYNFGESFEIELIAYITGEISEEVFVHFLEVNGLKLDRGLEELAPELPKMRNIFYKGPEQKKLLSEIRELPLVSIIIPTFNRKDMLKRAIDQALKQDYPNIELIVTDNCSEDGTEEMVRSNYKDEKKIIYNKNIRNIGPALNIYNAFYNIAKGKYCMITSDDDYIINHEFIKKAVLLLEKQNNMVFVFAGVYYNHEINGKVYRIKPDYPKFLDGRDFFINYTTEKYKYMPNQNALVFKRDKAIEMGVVRDNASMLAGDLHFQLRLLLTGNTGFINDIVLIYTLHKGSLSLNVNKCTEIGSDKASKAVISAISDIRELGETLILAQQYNFLAPGEDYRWFRFRIWKYMYWRINETAQTIKECNALVNYLEKEYPDIYDSLKNVAVKRFGEEVLK